MSYKKERLVKIGQKKNCLFLNLNMKILSSKLYTPTFRAISSKNESYWDDSPVDDEYFSQIRNTLREHYEPENIPYLSIYDTKNIEADKLFFDSLLDKPEYIANPSPVMSLAIRNLKPITETENSFRGQTLVDVPDYYLKVLKQSGINTLIDLVGYDSYDIKADNADLNYFHYPIRDVMKRAGFIDYLEYLKQGSDELKSVFGNYYDSFMDDRKDKKMYFSRECRETIDDMIKFIKLVQEDNFYISCQYGTDDTDMALMLNCAFNPQFEKTPLVVENDATLKKISNLYYYLTDEDKLRLGWSENYDDVFWDKYQKAENELLKIRPVIEVY